MVVVVVVVVVVVWMAVGFPHPLNTAIPAFDSWLAVFFCVSAGINKREKCYMYTICGLLMVRAAG